MTARVLLLFLMSGTSLASAGDYWLTVANEPHSPCARQQRAPSGVVTTARDVAIDVGRYFRGETPHLDVFAAAFGNARISFCGSAEREEVYRALVSAALADAVVHEDHLYDYAEVLGSEAFLAIVDARLADGTVPEEKAPRLRRMRESVTKGVQARK